MDAKNWLALFLTSIIAERGAARNTVDAYQRDLSDFGQYLADRGKSFATAAQSDIADYLISLAQFSAATRARRLSSIRQLYRFASEERWITRDPATRLIGPKKPRTLPHTLSEPQVDALLNAARTLGISTKNQIRNTCLMELLYATGMRVSELVSLPVTAVRGSPDMLLIRGKGGRERMVPLSKPAKIAMQNWLKHRDRDQNLAQSKGEKPSAHLFPATSKTGHLTRERFFLIVKDLAAAAGLARETVSPHTLRHAFASHLLAHGADLRTIQTLLGHADVATTEIYTHVIDERLRELVLTKHPLA